MMVNGWLFDEAHAPHVHLAAAPSSATCSFHSSELPLSSGAYIPCPSAGRALKRPGVSAQSDR